MLAPDILAEHAQARPLRQRDIDDFTSLGVPPLALTRTWFGNASFVSRERVVFDGQGRFEFERYIVSNVHEIQPPETLYNIQDYGSADVVDNIHEVAARNAFTVVVHNTAGDPADIYAWRPGFRGLWLGAVDVLGAEQLYAPRLGDPLDVWPNVIDWLRNDRRGIVIIDPVRAFDSLRATGTLRVQNAEQGRALGHVLRQQVPTIVVRETTYSVHDKGGRAA